MSDPAEPSRHLIFSVGTQVVLLRGMMTSDGRVAHPRGAIGVILQSPADLQHTYRVRFSDHCEEAVLPSDLASLTGVRGGQPGDSNSVCADSDLYQRMIFQCIIGSQAYDLADCGSDIDRRGIFLPPAELHWSLCGVPDQLQCDATQETYWELQKFLMLALKANPNVLECLYSPLVEKTTPLGAELLQLKSIFLSRLVYQTYNGYAMSQFRKMQADINSHGTVKWKHAMHLIRLLISGIGVLRDGFVPVQVTAHREQLLAIRRGEVSWEEIEKWRHALHREFNLAFSATDLPEQPDYGRANAFLLKARRAALHETLP